MEKALIISNLSKLFRLSEEGSYIALRDVISNSWKNLFKKRNKSFFPALNNINLSIDEGEVVGIIGPNGAGKSTLLKIISRITPPTEGSIVLNGKVASLLEVGTGFHPELTGRENIYLNGSILGLSKKEIDNRLHEIIEFSGVDQFIDTPLKNYSSGMQLRLAFSVAAHLDPDILLVDEVLAVGDMRFQEKCLGKMEKLSKEAGRTIIFVSHNLDVIAKFCTRTILLNKGEIVLDGPTHEVLQYYITNNGSEKGVVSWNVDSAPTDGNFRITKVYTEDQYHKTKYNFTTIEDFYISFEYEVLRTGIIYTHGVNIFNALGLNVFNSHDLQTSKFSRSLSIGRYKASVRIPSNLLADGQYSIGVALFSQQPFHIYLHEIHVIRFTIQDVLNNESARGTFSGEYGGIVRPKLEWFTKTISHD